MHNKFLHVALVALGLVIPNTSYAYFSYERAETAPKEIKQEIKKGQPKTEIKAVESKEVKQSVFPAPVVNSKVEVTSIKEPASKAINEIKKIGTLNPIVKPASSFTLGIGSLQAQLEKFSKDNGYTLVWNAENDYYLEAVTVFNGNYEGIIKDIFKALKGNNIFLKGTLYSNNVLEIKD